jgi:hypothetical protein
MTGDRAGEIPADSDIRQSVLWQSLASELTTFAHQARQVAERMSARAEQCRIRAEVLKEKGQ